MPWTTPSTVSTGDTLSAATWNQDVVANSLMGQPVFTNEAARDAAIPSPSEGQACYLTAPTVPAATGGTTAIPSGVTTIYNGSVWVCITPVFAFTNNTGTTTSNGYTATLSGSPGTNPTVTLVTGTTAMINIGAYISQNTGSGAIAEMSVAVSGAGTVAASSEWAITVGNNSTFIRVGRTTMITGLTAGTNTFTLQYTINASGGTGTFVGRSLMVQGVA